MALGIAAVAVPIAIAQWRGRRWPLYPGDAMMLGAFGFLLGPVGLAWTMLLGSAFSLAYRVWVQRQARPAHPQRPRAARPGYDRRGGRGVPVRQFRRCFRCRRTAAAWRAGRHGNGGHGNGFSLCPNSRGRKSCFRRRNWPRRAPRCPRQLPLGIWCSNRTMTPFPYRLALRRLSSLSGIATAIEERPARIAGGMAILSDAPPIRLVWRGALAGLLDRLAALSGYDWTLA